MLLEQARERVPERGAVVVVGGVHAEALAVAGEVEVAHGEELGRGVALLGVEERVREDLEEHRAPAVGEPEGVQQLRRRAVVVLGVGAGRVVGEHREGLAGTDVAQVAQPEAGALEHQGDEVDQRRARQVGEVLGRPLDAVAGTGDDGITADVAQEAQVGVETAQDIAQVVVLAEEAVVAVLHDDLGTVGQRPVPRPEPAAQRVGALEQLHAHPALGEDRRGADPGDPAPDDDRAHLAVGVVDARGEIGPGGDHGTGAEHRPTLGRRRSSGRSVTGGRSRVRCMIEIPVAGRPIPCACRSRTGDHVPGGGPEAWARRPRGSPAWTDDDQEATPWRTPSGSRGSCGRPARVSS